MKISTLLVLAILLSGCGLLQPITDKIAPAVIVYCNHSHAARLVVRDSINVALTTTGHTVHVHCKGDPEVNSKIDENAKQGTDKTGPTTLAKLEECEKKLAVTPPKSTDIDAALSRRLDYCEEGLTAIETILRVTFPQFFIEEAGNGDEKTEGGEPS